MINSAGVEMSHIYLSTACLHGLHDKCRLTCKYCGEPCACTECVHPKAELSAMSRTEDGDV